MTVKESGPDGKRTRRWVRRVAAGAMLLAAIAAMVFILQWERFKHNAEGILRARIVETLQTRFQSRVELDELHLTVGTDIGVNGGGLRLYADNPATPLGVSSMAASMAAGPTKTPLIEVATFSFHTNWQHLRRTPLHVDRVYVDGLHISLPPPVPGQPRFHSPPAAASLGNARPPDAYDKHSGITIVVDELHCTNASLVFQTSGAGKLPLDFEISKLDLQRVRGGMPLRFQATLVNPRPVGLIQSEGDFGPWNGADPGETALSGSYSFDHADLGTFKGIGGILSSTGKYAGVLGKMVVDGKTETPDFRLSVSGHPVSLHTQFHALVDGMNGDTYLQPVNATFLHTHLIASGKVVRMPEAPGGRTRGHLIQLDLTVDRGRIEDLLVLGVRTTPPVMTGEVQLRTKFDLPPGHDVSVTDRLRLNGTFTVTNGHFGSDNVQKKIDQLSMMGQGITKDSAQPQPANVTSAVDGHFTLRASSLTLTEVDYSVPGAHIAIDGVYSLDGNVFDLHGTARLNAKLSQMTTGWKSWLLKPVDPFFARHGAGTEVPFKVTGTKSEPKFGFDFGRKEELPVPPQKPTQH